MLASIRERFIKIRNNDFFEIYVAVVIVLSAINIGLNTYKDIPYDVTMIINYLDYGITIFFLFEIIIRITSEGSILKFFRSGWNIFDFLIVSASLIPAGLFESALILRLVRLFRVMRLISIFPQFRILIESLIKSIPRVGYVILFMFINFYMFAALGSIFFSELDPLHWGNIGLSLLTLFQTATLEGWPDLMYDAFAYNAYSWIFFVSFIILNSLIFMNMIVGVIIDVIVKENDTDTPENIKLLNEINLKIDQLQKLENHSMNRE